MEEKQSYKKGKEERTRETQSKAERNKYIDRQMDSQREKEREKQRD